MKIKILFLLSLIFSSVCFSQDFSNKGKDFWVGYGYHIRMNQTGANANTQEMILYFTSDVNATVKVEMPSVGYVRTYAVVAGQVTESEAIPKMGGQDARLNAEGTYNRGIHITADKPVVAYAHIYNASVSGASLLYPTPTLGREYYSINFTQSSNESNSNSWFYVIATEDNTLVEITPAAATVGGRAAGIPFTVSLNKGQIYNVMATTSGNNGGDLTGSKIKSIATASGGCKKIAVFSGSGKINIGCSSGSADNLIQQVTPISAWGKKFLTSPTNSQSNNYFRVLVLDPTTVVRRNGAIMTGLVNNFYYEFTGSSYYDISADKPILVAQYSTSQNCAGNGNPGDPEMIYLSPIEQTINKVTLNSTPRFQITRHFINVIIKNTGLSTFTLDGNPAGTSFLPHPQDPSFSYASFAVSAGSHTLYSDSGFNAIAYGYGNAESYGYNAGTNVIDLYQYVTLQNQYATVNFPATCKNTPFLFSITLPYLATSLTWDFNNNPNLTPNSQVVNNAPVPDSTFIRDGRTLYVYKIPGVYLFSAAGTYPIKVLANNPSPDGCSGLQEINYDVEVYEAPVANFNFNHNGCLSDSVKFTDASVGNGRPFAKWLWNFGDNTTDTVKNPVKLYTSPGTFNIKLRSITDIGCISDTTKTIVISPQPQPKFGVSGFQCINSTISFSDSSTIPQGNIVKWIWNFGNGNSITSTNNATQTQTYNAVGTYTVTLQVESNTGCKSVIFSRQVIINPNPVVNFNLPVVCLPVGAAQFTDQSTISDGTANLFTYQWTFGDGGTSTQKNPLHYYTATGPYQVKLTVTSNNGCIKDSTKTINTIYPQPKADFSVLPENCLRDTTIFTDQSNGLGSNVVKWNWNFGNGKTDTIQHPKQLYASAQTYVVKLFVFTDKGCLSDTMTKNVLVNPLPTADFSTSTPACETKQVIITSQSTPNAGNIVKWNWNFGDGSTPVSNTTGNPFPYTYATAGNYTINHSVETNKGCKSDTTSKPIVINVLPVAHFLLPDVCLSDAFAQFTDSSYMPNGVPATFTYSWNFGDPNSTPPANPNTSTLKNPQHKYSAVGIYDVQLTITAPSGCTQTVIKKFTVNGSIPKADFQVMNSNNLCSNTTIQLQNLSSVDFGSITKLEIIWDDINAPGTVETDLATTPGKFYPHNYPSLQTTQTYRIRLKAYSGGSCVDQVTKTITVNASPIVSFSAMADMCLSDPSRQIIEAKENGNVPGTFAFYGNGVSSTGLFTPTNAGTGLTKLKYVYVSNTGCRDSAEQTVRVYPNPFVNAGPDLFVLEGGFTNLQPIVTGTSLSYKWTPATYLDRDSIKMPRTTPLTDIVYVITATGIGGCKSSDDVKVNVLKAPSIPNVFSPNGDGINDVWNIKYLETYPGATVEVFNRYGQQVFISYNYSKPWDGTFNGNPLPVGVYYYIVNPKNGRPSFSGSVTIIR